MGEKKPRPAAPPPVVVSSMTKWRYVHIESLAKGIAPPPSPVGSSLSRRLSHLMVADARWNLFSPGSGWSLAARIKGARRRRSSHQVPKLLVASDLSATLSLPLVIRTRTKMMVSPSTDISFPFFLYIFYHFHRLISLISSLIS